jgi:hypothetical protein
MITQSLPLVMDTRFWGPAGWQLIHHIAQEPHEKDRAAVADWFRLLPYVLPCKYCRASLTDYLEAQPLMPATLGSAAAFSRWTYDLHNRVNAKLRGQGLLQTPDPAWPTVRDRYKTEHATLCKPRPLLGWNFLISVAYTTPGADYKPVPMPDIPEDATLAEQANWCLSVRNRYNLLTREERLRALAAWWRRVPSILPCPAWRAAWVAAVQSVGAPPLRRGRDAMMRWMWAVESAVCADLRCPTPHASREALCEAVGLYESGCGPVTSRRMKTCRKLLRTRRQTRRRRRTLVRDR